MKYAAALPVVAIGVLIGGCAVGPDYQRPQLAMPAAYPYVVKSVEQPIASDWWTLYGDNTLNTFGSRYEQGAFFGVSFGFISRESDFKGGFSSSTQTGDAALWQYSLLLMHRQSVKSDRRSPP